MMSGAATRARHFSKSVLSCSAIGCSVSSGRRARAAALMLSKSPITARGVIPAASALSAPPSAATTTGACSSAASRAARPVPAPPISVIAPVSRTIMSPMPLSLLHPIGATIGPQNKTVKSEESRQDGHEGVACGLCKTGAGPARASTGINATPDDLPAQGSNGFGDCFTVSTLWAGHRPARSPMRTRVAQRRRRERRLEVAAAT